MDMILIKHICRIPNHFQAVFLKELNMLQVKINYYTFVLTIYLLIG